MFIRAEIGVNNKLLEIKGFVESDGGWLDEKVLGRWIRGEDMETFPMNVFKKVERHF